MKSDYIFWGLHVLGSGREDSVKRLYAKPIEEDGFDGNCVGVVPKEDARGILGFPDAVPSSVLASHDVIYALENSEPYE